MDTEELINEFVEYCRNHEVLTHYAQFGLTQDEAHQRADDSEGMTYVNGVPLMYESSGWVLCSDAQEAFAYKLLMRLPKEYHH